jgi:hypothetical protein
MFFSAPSGNFDGNDNLVDLTGATVWETSPFTLPTGFYRLAASQSVSPAFTPTGTNGFLGGFVTGNATRSFLVAPAANFNANDNLVDLTGCVLSLSQNVTGLIGGVQYRALALTRASDVFEVVASDIPLRTFYDYDNVRVTFDTPVKVQFSADGSPVVISDRPISVISVAPPLSQVGPNGITYLSQGGMVAPLLEPAIQGWDEYLAFRLASATTGDFIWKASIPYGNNVNPQAPGNGPLVFTEGAHGCYIQSMWKQFAEKFAIARYIPLVTVVPAPLQGGDFRPGVSGAGAARTNYGANANNINLNVLRNDITRPASCRSLEEIVDRLPEDRLRPVWNAKADEEKRRMETSIHGEYGQNYGGEVAYDMLALHFTNDNALKMQKVLAVIQRAIDLRSMLDKGYRYGIGAGQNANGWVELVYAGFFLNDQSFLDAAIYMRTNTTGQNFSPPWPEMIGRNTPWPGDTGSTNVRFIRPYYSEHEYMWLSGSHEDSDSMYTAGGYFFGNDAMTIMETMAIALLVNGPGGITGEDWLDANGFRFLIDIMDDRDAMVPTNNGSIRYFPPLRAAYEACRPSLSAVTMGRPIQTGPGLNDAITGGFRSNFTGYNYSRLPITDRQSRLSIDRRWGPTWAGRSSTITDTTSGVLLGVPQWEQTRSFNDAGAGLWSSIYPDKYEEPTTNPVRAGFETPEPKITPIGSAGTGTPVNSHAPMLLIRPYSAHAALRLEEFSGGTVPVNTRQLYGSVGYWFGGGAPASFDYKFQEDVAGTWVDIAGTSGNIALATIGGVSAAVGPNWGIIDTYQIRGKSVRFATRAISAAAAVSGWAYSTAATVPARTEKLDYLAPDPAFQLKDLNYRYKAGLGVALSFHAARGSYPGYLMTASGAGQTAGRVITIDQLPVLGDLSDVPEGEVLIQWSRGNQSSATRTRATFNFYTSGADQPSLSGYAVEYEVNSLGWRHLLRQITSGVYGGSTLNSGTYRDNVEAGPAFNQGDIPVAGVSTRVNWSLEGGSLRVKVKSWARWDYAPSRMEEPAAWQDNWLIPGPLIASGRIGFGIKESERDVKVMGIGVSIDPTISAKHVPEVPAYTY